MTGQFSNAAPAVRQVLAKFEDVSGEFVAEFAALETHFIGTALGALSDDTSFVRRAEKSLGVAARLKLVERMAYGWELDAELIAQIDGADRHVEKLAVKRDELVRAREQLEAGSPLPSPDAPLPAPSDPVDTEKLWSRKVIEIIEYKEWTQRLQATLRAVSERATRRRSASAVVA